MANDSAVELVRQDLENAQSEIEEAINDADGLCTTLQSAEDQARDGLKAVESALDNLRDMEREMDEKDERIEALEDENAELKRKLEASGGEHALCIPTSDAFVCHDNVFKVGNSCPECGAGGALLSLTLAAIADLRESVNQIARHQASLLDWARS